MFVPSVIFHHLIATNVLKSNVELTNDLLVIEKLWKEPDCVLKQLWKTLLSSSCQYLTILGQLIRVATCGHCNAKHDAERTALATLLH